MATRKRNIIDRKRKTPKEPVPELAIDMEQNDRRFELVSILILFLFGLYQSILLYGHHIMPSPDFPSFIDVGRKLWHFQLPTIYQRGPTYGLIVYPLSLITGGQHPELTAAWIFNSVLQPCNLVLMYLIGKRFVGKSAFWIAIIAILNPWMIEVFTKPLAEVGMLFFTLITLYLMFNRSRLCYVFASMASVLRYECAALILAAFVMDMIYGKSKKERINAFIYSALACIPLGLWVTGTLYFYPDKNGESVSYLQFMNLKQLFKFDVLSRELNLLWSSTIGTLFTLGPKVSTDAFTVKLLAITTKIIAGLSFLFGSVWGMIKKQWNMIAIQIFFILYMIIHISYGYSEPRFYIPVQWMFLLICWYGIKSFWQIINANERIPKFAIIIVQGIALLLFIIWISALVSYFTGLSSYSPRTIYLPYAAIIASILAVAAYTYIYRGKNLLRNIVIISFVSIIFCSNQYTVARIVRDGTHDGEFKQLLDWYKQNAKPGEKLVSTLASLLSVLDPKDKDCFISPGDLKADTPEGFIDNCYKEGITYVTWDSRIGFSPENVFYQLAKLENIAFLRNKQSVGPYEYITTIVHPTEKNRYINIFRLRPRPELPAGQ